jgi:hypothetical protein
LGADAIFLFTQFGSELRAEVFSLENLANLNYSFALLIERPAADRQMVQEFFCWNGNICEQ